MKSVVILHTRTTISNDVFYMYTRRRRESFELCIAMYAWFTHEGPFSSRGSVTVQFLRSTAFQNVPPWIRPWRQQRGEQHHQLHLHLSLNRGGRWCTTDDFTASFLHFSVLSTALWDLVDSRSIHSLTLSFHLFFCLPCLLTLFTVPFKSKR